MLKRLNIYFKEMFPIIPRLILALIIFSEIYFYILLNEGIVSFKWSIAEWVGIYTIFSFYMWLRIADDFKDYELDKLIFSARPLPSGRVTKRDLAIVCTLTQTIAIGLNFYYMNNVLFFVVLYAYGYLMSKWFFRKKHLQSSLPLALITHNPVQLFVNLYIISFVLIKYDVHYLSWYNALVLWTLYFPSLIWEVSRKVRAPQDENDYTTYSKLFGYQRATRFVWLITLIDLVTNVLLVWHLNKITVMLLLVLAMWLAVKIKAFIANPQQFKLVQKIEQYTYIQESLMLVSVVVYLTIGKI